MTEHSHKRDEKHSVLYWCFHILSLSTAGGVALMGKKKRSMRSPFIQRQFHFHQVGSGQPSVWCILSKLSYSSDIVDWNLKMNKFFDDEGQKAFQMKFMKSYQFHSGGAKQIQEPAKQLQNSSWTAVFSDEILVLLSAFFSSSFQVYDAP